MLVAVLYLIAGLAILIWSADRFVDGASSLARNSGISPLLIGLTVVALGTSAPEMFVAIVASLKGNPALAIGNAMGSNIANIGLILGIAALISPLDIGVTISKRELPILLGIMMLAGILLTDGNLGRVDAVLLIVALITLLVLMVYQGSRQQAQDLFQKTQDKQESHHHMSNQRATVWLSMGLILMPISSALLVRGATDIANQLGVSDMIVGLSVIALGTSLPELTTAIIAAIRKEHALVLGNVLGSNMFNLLAVLPFPGLIKPGPTDPDLMTRDFVVMLILTLALLLSSYGFRSKKLISRIGGAVLLCIYGMYIFLLYLSAS